MRPLHTFVAMAKSIMHLWGELARLKSRVDKLERS